MLILDTPKWLFIGIALLSSLLYAFILVIMVIGAYNSLLQKHKSLVHMSLPAKLKFEVLSVKSTFKPGCNTFHWFSPYLSDGNSSYVSPFLLLLWVWGLCSCLQLHFFIGSKERAIFPTTVRWPYFKCVCHQCIFVLKLLYKLATMEYGMLMCYLWSTCMLLREKVIFEFCMYSAL